VSQVGLDSRVPCAFGVLTVDTREQALERSGGGRRHAGREAAETVLRMAALRRELTRSAV
jgi:6,7-dimethyl-8-ribityllumazine synthase